VWAGALCFVVLYRAFCLCAALCCVALRCTVLFYGAVMCAVPYYAAVEPDVLCGVIKKTREITLQ
jgi:hypothetical protein